MKYINIAVLLFLSQLLLTGCGGHSKKSPSIPNPSTNGNTVTQNGQETDQILEKEKEQESLIKQDEAKKKELEEKKKKEEEEDQKDAQEQEELLKNN
jgi:hypothetical protein